jgi:hypothetical protein
MKAVRAGVYVISDIMIPLSLYGEETKVDFRNTRLEASHIIDIPETTLDTDTHWIYLKNGEAVVYAKVDDGHTRRLLAQEAFSRNPQNMSDVKAISGILGLDIMTLRERVKQAGPGSSLREILMSSSQQ